MTKNNTRRLVTFIIAVLLGALGGWMVRNWTASDAWLERESARQIDEYVPICDHKEMRPGDYCMVLGGNNAADRGGSYKTMVDRHTASVSPQRLRQEYHNIRVSGYVLIALAALLLLRVLWVTWVAVRSGPVRRSLARRQGWTYQREDALLASRAWSAVLEPGTPRATDIVTGTRNGTPFTLYTFRTKGDRARTAFLAALPTAVPRMAVLKDLPARIHSSTSPEGKALLVAKLGVLPGDSRYGSFAAEGTTLMRSGPLSGNRSAVLRGIDEVTTLAGQIAAAAYDTTGTGDAERVAEFIRRTGPDAPAARATPLESTYRPRLIGAAVGLLIAAGGGWLVSVDWPVIGSIVAVLGALILLGNVLGLVSVRRTRVGRPRFAAAHGWKFQDADPTLVQRLSLPALREFRPAAAAVIAGVRAGLPFLIFDAMKGASKETVYAIQLPAPVPTIKVRGGSANQALDGTSTAGTALLTNDVWQVINAHFKHVLTAEGTWIVAVSPYFLSPRAARMEQFLNGLTSIGTVLSRAASAHRQPSA